jgi:hypothetical protein
MSLSNQLFQLMLLAYPREFRLEYGLEMTQLFRDCYRDIQSGGLISAIVFWRRTIFDVLRTAPLERWEALERRCETMKNLKTEVLGFVACLAIIAGALGVFNYLRKSEVPPVWIIGFSLDAIITAGVVSSLIIFLLAMAARLRTFRTAVWTLAIVHGAPLLIATLLSIRIDPGFRFGMVLVAYAISFIFWLGVHWLRSQLRTSNRYIRITNEDDDEIFLFDSRCFSADVSNRGVREDFEYE